MWNLLDLLAEESVTATFLTSGILAELAPSANGSHGAAEHVLSVTS